MMKLLSRRLLTILVLTITLFITITVATYAWTNNTYIYSQDIIGKSRKSYFDSGTGTELDPFIINEPEHFFNLAYLQNLGQFNGSTYYFELSSSIDFSQASVDLYKTIYPIGTGQYPFVGSFEGNFYTISNFSVDGNGLQDIGVFGNLGDYSVVQNLFIEQPTIISNPSTSDDKTYFHEHNNNQENRATGYIVGHLNTLAVIDNVYVIDPTISSLSNADFNRSEYGLVGFNEYDDGNTVGSPRGAYNFDLDAISADDALAYAYTAYSSYNINGSTTLTLSDALTSTGTLNTGYTLSTLLITDPDSNNDPAPLGTTNLVYLYDQLVADGYTIGAYGSEYNRLNIDVVGTVDFGSTNYQIYENMGASGFVSPTVGATFNAYSFDNAIFLYVRPTNNPSDLGDVTGTYGGGGDLSYLSSYDTNGDYVAGRYWANKNATGVVNFGASGVTQTMQASNAFCAIQEDVDNPDPDTGEPVYKVVDETVTPDYYVFLVAVTNGQITISDINFSYSPADPTADDYTSLGNIDYINANQKAGIIADPSSYTNSYFFFNYDITVNQYLEVYVEKNWDTQNLVYYYDLYIDYSITDSSIFYFDIYNISNSTINIYINDVFDSGNPYSLIEIQFSSGSYIVSVP
ncbi:hypothetical protein ACAG96_03325 [Candidatus Izemoplasma sp. B36]|uniref:hypothetical protein n=1 Tax=Candidatus Izemoplasma sp. B36 TaxID=3242468 RepID=UPI0035569F20